MTVRDERDADAFRTSPPQFTPSPADLLGWRWVTSHLLRPERQLDFPTWIIPLPSHSSHFPVALQ